MTAGTDLSPPWTTTTPGPPLVRNLAPPMQTPPRAALGGWWRRLLALYLDTLIALVALSPLLGLAALAGALSDGIGSVVVVLGYVAYVGFWLWQLVRQGRTGATYGKELLGLRLVAERTGQPVGAGASVGRYFVHILDYLPLGLGYLLPVVDRKRQTIADKTMGTLVLRVPSRRVPLRLVGLVVLVSGVLSTGALVALGDTLSPVLAPVEQPATQAGQPAAPAPPAAPTGPLPIEDTAGRIGPAAPGFTPVSDDVSELGPLDVSEAASLGGASPEQAAVAEEGLRSLGLVGAYGRGFETEQDAYTVLAYRFSTPDGAARFQDQLPTSLESVQPTAVPGGVVFDASGEDFGALGGLFTVGSYGYEVTLFGEPGAVDGAMLEELMVRQYEHALLTG